MVTCLKLDVSLLPYMFSEPSHVRDLKLSSAARTINVSWTNPVGGHLNFSVKLYDPEKEIKTHIINNSPHHFDLLNAGANYTVEVQVMGFGELSSISKFQSIFTCKYTSKYSK